MARIPRRLAGIGATDLIDAAAFDSYVGPARELTVDPVRGILALHDGSTEGGIRFMEGGGGGSTWVRAADYGAVADGVTDDAGSIQDAIDYLHRIGGGGLALDRGTYALGDSLVLYSGVQIAGVGVDQTVLKLKNGVNKSIVTTYDTAALWGTQSEDGEQWWGLMNLTIDGNRANNTSGHGVYTYSRAYLLFRVKIINCAENGIRSAWGDGAAWSDSDASLYDPFMEAMISDLYVGYCGKEGIWFDGPHDSRLSNVMVALNSQSSTGAYSGIYLGANAGGTTGVAVHSWGDTQKYAWDIDAGYTYWTGCIADDAYEALVFAKGSVFTWTGGIAFGAVFGAPTAQDKVMKGFVFGQPGTLVRNVHLDTQVVNCPGGAIDVTYLDPLGAGQLCVSGYIQDNLKTVATGLQTYGFVGAIPPYYNTSFTVLGVENSFALAKFADSLEIRAGTASFPTLRKHGDVNTGLYFPADDMVGVAANGGAVAIFNGDKSITLGTRSGVPVTTWTEGLIYYDTSTHKLRCYNGASWVDLF